MARFKNTISSLEAQLRQLQQQQEAFEAEQQALRHKEAGLLATLCTLQCSVSAIASKVPNSNSPQSSQQQHSGEPAGPHEQGSRGGDGGGEGGASSSSVGGSLQPNNSSSGGGRSHACVQQQLAALEQLLEGTMQQAFAQDASPQAVSGVFNSLHTSRTIAVLRGLAADPGQALAFLALSMEDRVKLLARCVQQLGVLLPKYDSQPRFRAELEAIVQRVVAGGLTYTWLDPEANCLVDLQLTNLETGQQEAGYPPGFWQHVVQAVEFTPDQRVSLHALYSRMQGLQASLLAQHDALLQQLDELQLQQEQEQQLFAQQAQQLPIREAVQLLWWGRHYEQQVAAGQGLPQQQQEQREGKGTQQQQEQHLQRPPLQALQPQSLGGGMCQTARPADAAAAAAAAGAAGAGGAAVSQQSSIDIHRQHSTPSQQSAGGRDSQQAPSNTQTQQQQQSAPHHPNHHLAVFEPPLVADPATAVLLPPSSPDQRRLEAQLSAIRGRLALHEKLLACHLWNTCSLKQLATIMVSSWPFQPDSMAMCGALQELGWYK